MNREGASKPTLLLVDDELAVHETLAQILRLEGFAVRGATNLDEALRIADAGDCDLVLTDLSLTGPRGLEGLLLLDALRARRPALPVALFTARGTPEILAEARRRGAADAWGKDVPIEEMIRRLRRLVSGAQESSQ